MDRVWRQRAPGRAEGWAWLGAATIAILVALGIGGRACAEEEIILPEPALVFEQPVDTVAAAASSGLPACARIPHVLDPLGVDPLWSGRAEALLLWRQSPQGLTIFENAAGGTALDADQLGSGMAAGPRFTLFRHTGDDGALEFNYLRVQAFEASRDLPPTAGGYFQTSHGIYCCPTTIAADTIETNLSSGLQSFELNRRFPTTGGWQWLTGFRWVEWREGIAIQTSGVQGLLRNSYSTSTINDLYGWQAGADSILYGLGGPFRIEGLGKAGLYYNNAVQTSVRTTTAAIPPSYALGTAIGQAAFVGEVGLTAVYDVNDWLTLRGGYAAFWLGGIAQAPNQLFEQEICPGQPLAGRTDTGGSVWVQGITLGLEARY